MPKPKQCCGSCRWGVFRMTTHAPPRIAPNATGKCDWPMPPATPLPLAITRHWAWGASLPRRGLIADETGCPCWEAKP